MPHMRRIRLAISGPSPCGRCHANCCKQNGHDFAVLLTNDEARRFAPFAVRMNFERAGRRLVEAVLPYVDGRCQFLDDEDRCRIYDDRPAACRTFECVEYFNAAGVGAHGRFLRLNPDVLELLEGL